MAICIPVAVVTAFLRDPKFLVFSLKGKKCFLTIVAIFFASDGESHNFLDQPFCAKFHELLAIHNGIRVFQNIIFQINSHRIGNLFESETCPMIKNRIVASHVEKHLLLLNGLENIMVSLIIQLEQADYLIRQ